MRTRESNVNTLPAEDITDKYCHLQLSFYKHGFQILNDGRDQEKMCKQEIYHMSLKNGGTLFKKVLKMETKTNERMVACKLTAPEMQKRKQEAFVSLKAKLLNRYEIDDGYKYEFSGTDKVIDEVVTFIKYERLCCDFLTFSLSVSDNESSIFLSITGTAAAKEFVKMEMDLS